MGAGLLGLERSSWLFVLILLLTLLPAAGVLWFMSAAVTSESASARQRVMEAYRGQLRLVRARMDPLWRAHAARLDGAGTPERQFERLIVEDLADGAVLLNERGAVLYPEPASRPAGPPAGARPAEAGADPADVADLVIGGSRGVDEWASRLNDYGIHLPARARLRMMERLRARAANVLLGTQAALALSIEVSDAERLTPIPDVIRQTSVPDIWALSSPSGRVVALYRTGRIEAMMHDFLHLIDNEGIVFIAFPPDEAADAEAIAAGSWLPGWQLSFVPLDAAARNAADARKRTRYVAIALAGVALIALVGVTVGQTMRRHLQLARLKTDLVAAVSHELRTPLASMRVLVDGLLADAEIDPAKTREYLGLLSVENARLTRLIEDFLTFSRLDRGRTQFVFDDTDAASVAHEAVATVRERMPPSGDLHVAIEPSLPTFAADAQALRTALVNLLDNAIKYSADEPRIEIQASRDGDSVAFAVSDNGIGIAPEQQRRIFRRFYRVDQSLSRQTSGVGLGLSIVELIARGHGGTVRVASQPGHGSTFTIRVPIARRTTGA
jgi:signal transduction histidine kinase